VFLFLFPLLLGFAFNALSAFTASFSKKWGDRTGALISIVFRDVLGIPVWVIGFYLAALAPATNILPRWEGIQIIGWVLIAAGGLVILAALFTIRLRSLAPSVKDSLVGSGLYASVRHPIHSGTLLEFAGLFLLRPSAAIGLACALGFVWVLVQTVFEERDLLQRIPEYREYMNQVPRYFPRIG
jgi:protein-S-isoprenylcysteine O-methyltransferase Ste14